VTSHILVVDDVEKNVRLLADVLGARGYRTSTAASGEAALQAIQRETPDLVLLDVMMPGLDGYAVCRAIRADPAHAMLPVVMLTAAADDAQAWQAWSGGVDYFLAKPFDASELLRYLDHLFSDASPVAG